MSGRIAEDQYDGGPAPRRYRRRCFVCRRSLHPVVEVEALSDEEIPVQDPSQAIDWHAPGCFGSGLWNRHRVDDGSVADSYLHIVICDACVAARADLIYRVDIRCHRIVRKASRWRPGDPDPPSG